MVVKIYEAEGVELKKKKIAGWPAVDVTYRGWSDDCGEFAMRFGIGIAVR